MSDHCTLYVIRHGHAVAKARLTRATRIGYQNVVAELALNLVCLTLIHSMPSFSNILWMGSSFASTTTLLESSMRTFMDSHFEPIQRGWLSGITGLGTSTTCHRRWQTHDKHCPCTDVTWCGSHLALQRRQFEGSQRLLKKQTESVQHRACALKKLSVHATPPYNH